MDKILIALLLVLVLTGCSSKLKQASGDYKKLSAKEAKEIIDAEEVIILDVRTPQEYKDGHIEGALLIPDYELAELADSKLPDKDEKILIYCRSGNRSKTAAKRLTKMGYTNIYDFGGINSWTYDTVKGSN